MCGCSSNLQQHTAYDRANSVKMQLTTHLARHNKEMLLHSCRASDCSTQATSLTCALKRGDLMEGLHMRYVSGCALSAFLLLS